MTSRDGARTFAGIVFVTGDGPTRVIKDGALTFSDHPNSVTFAGGTCASASVRTIVPAVTGAKDASTAIVSGTHVYNNGIGKRSISTALR